MIVKLSNLASAMDKVSDMTFKEKQVPGVMLDMQEDGFDICFACNGKALVTHVDAIMEEGDPKERIILGYTEFSRIIEGCKPSGSIITEDIQFRFEEKTVIITAKKVIQILNKDGTPKYKKIASVIEQSLSWTPASETSTKSRALAQERYDLYKHYDDEYIDANYTNDNEMKPLSDSEFIDVCDTWDKDELRSILTRLAIDDSAMVTISYKHNIAFIYSQSSTIVIPIKRDEDHKLKNSFTQSSAAAKAIASVLGRIPDTQETVTTHTVQGNKFVITSEDGDTLVAITNMKPRGVFPMVQANISRSFSNYMLNFHREVLESVLQGAKAAGSADKVVISFEYTNDSGIRQEQNNEDDGQTSLASDEDKELAEQFEDDEEFGGDGPLSQEELDREARDMGEVMAEEAENARYVKMVILIKNTLKSVVNRYEMLTDKVIDPDNNIDKLQLAIGIDQFIQAVKGAKSTFIAFDIDTTASKSNSLTLRIAEIDLKEMAQITAKLNIPKKWPDNVTIEHRKEILGYTTFITAVQEKAE